MKIAKKTKIESLKAIIADKTLDESFRNSASEKLAALEAEPSKKKMKVSSISNPDNNKTTDMKTTKKSALETAKEKSKTKKSKSVKRGKMKFFIYVREEGKASRTRSGVPLTFRVFEIADNIPAYVGEAKANSASYKGDESTVMNFLASEGKIPDSFKDGYYRRSEPNEIFTITGL